MIYKSKKVIIVGGGWAGLSAAMTLAQNGIDVTLIDPSSESRESEDPAPNFASKGKTLNNHQSIFWNSYPKTQALLDSMGIAENQFFTSVPFRLWVESQNAGVDLKLNNCLFPMNFMLALMTAEGLSKTERKAALKFYNALMTLNFEIKEDMALETLLLEYKQPQSLIEHLWAPLARLILNTPIEEASAQVFLKTLKKILGTSDKPDKPLHFLFPKTHLSTILQKPMLDFLSKKQVHIHDKEKVQSLIFEQGLCQGIQTEQQHFLADEIILALPPDRARELLLPHIASHPELSEAYQKLQKFHTQTITTVYLELDKPADLPYPILGLAKQTGHWLFDESIRSEPNILCVTLIGKGEHLNLNPSALATTLHQELKQKFPHLGQLLHYQVMTDNRTMVSTHMGIDQDRPLAKLPGTHITLAGDYTQLGTPASVEAALESGIMAAEYLISESMNLHKSPETAGL